SPGSHVTTRSVRPEHPLSWGYDEVDWVFRGNLPIYAVREQDRGHVVLQFGTQSLDEAEKKRDSADGVEASAYAGRVGAAQSELGASPANAHANSDAGVAMPATGETTPPAIEATPASDSPGPGKPVPLV